jgi:hypothetical protein
MNGGVSEKLRRLSRIPESRFPFLSVYLDTKSDAPGKRDEVRIFLKNSIRDAGTVIDGRAERESFERDAERILRFVDEELHRTHTGDGQAVFACGGEDVFEVIPSQRPFQSQFLVSNRPLIRQIAVLMDDYEPVAACVIDRQSARIFEITTGEVLERGLKSDVPREGGNASFHGWGDLKYQRDVRGHIEHHFRDVAYQLTRLVEDGGYRRIVLLGQEPVLQNFRRALPKRVDERVIATGPADMRAPRDRIVAHVRDVVSLEEKRQERELIGLIRDQALSGNLGVFGLEATLNALRKGQVYKLAIDADDLKAHGWRCHGCHALATHLKKDACPYCGGATDPVELGDEIVKDAVAQGAEIETVQQSAELARMGKLGALLRFRD